MKVNKALCLFEQSGTFKNEFIKLGIPAEDYDILNDFGETNNVCDLFAEIRRGYNNEPSIFDNVTPDDLLIAFFPCVRFENQINLWFRGASVTTSVLDARKENQIRYRLNERSCKELRIIQSTISRLY